MVVGSRPLDSFPNNHASESPKLAAAGGELDAAPEHGRGRSPGLDGQPDGAALQGIYEDKRRRVLIVNYSKSTEWTLRRCADFGA